jgi:hypothetical protein
MRSGLVAGLMGIGGILISFGAVVVVLSIFARQGETRHELPAMTTLAVGSIVVGAVMFGAGFLLSRLGRRSDDSSGAALKRT